MEKKKEHKSFLMANKPSQNFHQLDFNEDDLDVMIDKYHTKTSYGLYYPSCIDQSTYHTFNLLDLYVYILSYNSATLEEKEFTQM